MDIALDEWRPGFARRTNDFADLVDVAARWRWEPGMSADRAKSLVAVATPDLTDGERSVLFALLEHLDADLLKASEPFVWPSARLLGLELNKSESVIRERRAALERKRYLIRDYNHANRPAGEEAINLAPLFSRLDELATRRVEILNKNAALRDSWKSQVVDISSFRAQAPENRRLEQSHLNQKIEVTESAAPTARSSYEGDRATPERGRIARPKEPSRRNSGDRSAIGSPKRARGLGPAKMSDASIAKMVRDELQMAVEVCPALSAILTPEIIANPAQAGLLQERQLDQLANETLPEPHRNNGLSVQWSWRRHGIRSAAMLAVALTDPKVVNPCRYFGRLATSPPTGELDLRLNLARILKWQNKSAPPIEHIETVAVSPAAAEVDASFIPATWPTPPGADHPTWLAIAQALRRRIGKGRFDTWFAPNVGFAGFEQGVLAISAPTIPAERISKEFHGHVIAAAAEAGFKVVKLMVTVRRFSAT